MLVVVRVGMLVPVGGSGGGGGYVGLSHEYGYSWHMVE